MEISDHKLEKVGTILKFPLKELNKFMVKVKLNEKGWKLYKERNGFADSNIDDDGYSTFSYDYFEELFYPMQYSDFSYDVIMNMQEEKND